MPESGETIRGRLAALDAAARYVGGLYFTFLAFAAYLTAAVFSTTDEQLLIGGGVALPLIGVALPLVGFFSVAPWLLVMLHFNLLLQHHLLARRTRLFQRSIEALRTQGEREEMLDLVYPLPFVQVLLGEHLSRTVRNLLGVMVVTTVVIVPLWLLLATQARFVAYHGAAITWLQRLAILVDVVLLWAIWPATISTSCQWRDGVVEAAKVLRSDVRDVARWLVRPLRRVVRPQGARAFSARSQPAWGGHGIVELTTMTTAALVSAFLIVTVPGEQLDGWASRVSALAGARRLVHRNLVVGVPVPSLTSQLTWDYDSNRMPDATPLSLASLGARGRDLRNMTLRGVRVEGAADFRNAKLRGARLYECDLRRADFERADLTGAQLANVWLDDARLSRATLDGVLLRGVRLDGAELLHSSLVGSSWDGVMARGANLEGANLRRSRILRGSLTGSRLVRADMSRMLMVEANVSGGDFTEASFRGATIAGSQAVAARFTHSSIHNAARFVTDFSLADFRQVKWRMFKPEKYQRIVLGIPEARPFRPILQALGFAGTDLGSRYGGAIGDTPMPYKALIGVTRQGVKWSPPEIYEPEVAHRLADLACAHERVLRGITWRITPPTEASRGLSRRPLSQGQIALATQLLGCKRLPDPGALRDAISQRLAEGRSSASDGPGVP